MALVTGIPVLFQPSDEEEAEAGVVDDTPELKAPEAGPDQGWA